MPGWTAIFRGIPWMELIVAAPAIARGARKLWAGIRNQPDIVMPGDSAARLTQLESQVAELKKELAAATDLIKAMAEQNERLLEADCRRGEAVGRLGKLCISRLSSLRWKPVSPSPSGGR